MPLAVVQLKSNIIEKKEYFYVELSRGNCEFAITAQGELLNFDTEVCLHQTQRPVL